MRSNSVFFRVILRGSDPDPGFFCRGSDMDPVFLDTFGIGSGFLLLEGRILIGVNSNRIRNPALKPLKPSLIRFQTSILEQKRVSIKTWTNWIANICWKTKRQRDKHTNRHTDEETFKQRDKHANRHTNEETYKQRDKQANRHTDEEKYK